MAHATSMNVGDLKLKYGAYPASPALGWRCPLRRHALYPVSYRRVIGAVYPPRSGDAAVDGRQRLARVEGVLVDRHHQHGDRAALPAGDERRPPPHLSLDEPG